MPPKQIPPGIVILFSLALAVSPLFGQTNTEFQIKTITPALVETPNFTGPSYTKRGPRAKQWLEIEVNFDWESRKEKYADELTVNYYILLNNKGPENQGKGTLLVGSVTHTCVPAEKGLSSVMYVSPRVLERMFGGKAPTNTQQALLDVGISISKQGQLVADASWKGRGTWWSTYQQVTGFVLNKNETPFAPLAWDYFEAIKAKGGSL